MLPQLYSLPKIHKPGEKTRPFISSINVAKIPVEELNKLSPPPGKCIKNSFDFEEKIKNCYVETDDILVSFDVESLYPNIPVAEAMDIIDKWLKICNLSREKSIALSQSSKLCINQNSFTFQNDFYKQIHVVNMGIRCHILSPILSSETLNKLLKRLISYQKIWMRYVDDIFNNC